MPPETKHAPVKVIREGNNVHITAYVRFSGNYMNRMFESGQQYWQIAAASIEAAWSGKFSILGQEANVVTKVFCMNSGVLPDGNLPERQKFLRIKITGGTLMSRIMRSHEKLSFWGIIRNNETITSWSIDKSSTPIVLYTTENFQGSNPYKHISQNVFAAIAAHEFGHALGLGDAYNAGYRGGTYAGSLDGHFAPKSYEVADENGKKHIMEVPDDDMMLSNGRVSDNDMRMVLEAYRTGRQQFFPRGPKLWNERR